MTVIFNQRLEVGSPREVHSRLSTEPLLDWSSPDWQEVDFLVSVQPNGSTEGPVERSQTVTGYVLITPPGTDIPELTSASRVRIGGVLVCDINGVPERWPDPFQPGVVHHLEALLEVVDG